LECRFELESLGGLIQGLAGEPAMRKIIRVAMIAATACVLLSAARNRRNRLRPLLLADC
jgi:hypothetical protein